LSATQVGGNWLAWWIVLAAAASQIGQFQAEMSSDSYQLQGMAERGFLPKALASRSKHGTPTYGILLSRCALRLTQGPRTATHLGSHVHAVWERALPQDSCYWLCFSQVRQHECAHGLQHVVLVEL
jgi:hypothetical protein